MDWRIFVHCIKSVEYTHIFLKASPCLLEWYGIIDNSNLDNSLNSFETNISARYSCACNLIDSLIHP